MLVAIACRSTTVAAIHHLVTGLPWVSSSLPPPRRFFSGGAPLVPGWAQSIAS